MADNRSHLTNRFFQRLRELEPGSVLDVGCGAGHLLELCRDAGIAAEGVEADARLVAELSDQGLLVHQGDASGLPKADASFDLVTLRHVLHHLEDVATALDEACRVARTGVLVVEPWHDQSIPSQALALRFDSWMKRQDQRLGQTHQEDLAARQILALLPVDGDFEIDWQCYVRLREQPLQELQALATPLLEGLSDDDAERQEFDNLVQEARRHGITYNGTMILCLRRR